MAQELSGFERFEIFFDEYQKQIIAGAVVVLVLVAAIFGVKNFYLPKREAKAQSALFPAQVAFDKDSFRLALEGDGTNAGFLQIAKDYKFTKAANLSHYYAGICDLNLKDYDGAIAELKKFSGNDKIVGAMALGLMGDAYSEKGDMTNAIKYYKDAADYNDNDYTAPMYLTKAGLALEVNGKYKELLETLKKVKENYPKYQVETSAIDKHIARVEQEAK